MRLLLVEIDRFRSRRAIAMMLLGMIALVGLMTVSTIMSGKPIDLVEELGNTGFATIIFVTGLATVMGSTYAGNDWNTGSMSNQLLFRPRRLEVWFTKGAAVAVSVAGIAAVLLTVPWVAYLVAAKLRDEMVPGDFLGMLVQYEARGIVLAAAGGLAGFALAMLVRNTVGPLAVLFFYSVGGEVIINLLPFDRVSRFSVAYNVDAWINNGTDVFEERMKIFRITAENGATFLGVLLALLGGLSLWSFLHRDTL